MRVPQIAPSDGLYRGAKNRQFIQDGIVHSDAYLRRPPVLRNGVLQPGDPHGLSIGFAEMETPKAFQERSGSLAKYGVIGITVGEVTQTGLVVKPSVEHPDESGNALHGNIVGMPYADTTEQMDEWQAKEVDARRAQILQLALAAASKPIIEM